MRAVQFNKSVDQAMGYNKAFPFVYNMIGKNDDEWVPTTANTYANLVGVGLAVPSGGSIRHAIKLDPDYNFKLLRIRYTAYHLYDDLVHPLHFIWYDPLPGIATWMIDTFDPNMSIGTPLINYLRISVSFAPDARFLYGDKNLDQTVNGGPDMLRLPINMLQGYESGYAQVRTPYLLPSYGYLMFEIVNTHPVKELLVGLAAGGMKIRL